MFFQKINYLINLLLKYKVFLIKHRSDYQIIDIFFQLLFEKNLFLLDHY